VAEAFQHRKTSPVVQIIANPDAGSSSRRRLRALQHAFSAAGARIVQSESRAGEVRIDPDAEHICIVGGDGTLRHVAAAVHRSGRPVTLSLYPMGTVNLIARERGYSRNPGAFVARILSGDERRDHYVAMIGDIILSGVASVGPDSFAVDNLSVPLKRLLGRFAYVLAFLTVLGRWQRPQLQVATGDGVLACEAIYIAKGRYFAGPWSFAPRASVEQRLLHGVALRRARRIDFARFVWTLWRGLDLTRDPNLMLFSCDRLTIGGTPAPLQADGDVVATTPVAIAIQSEPFSFA
jgi:diacylglycerol kinase family enzyme